MLLRYSMYLYCPFSHELFVFLVLFVRILAAKELLLRSNDLRESVKNKNICL